MLNIELSLHAREMLAERHIPEEWVWRTLQSPTATYRGEDGNTHYLRAIEEADSRILRVVVNPEIEPQRVVTVFFDRRLRGKTLADQ